MYVLFGHFLLCCLLSGGRVSEAHAVTRARGEDNCSAAVSPAKPGSDSSDLPGNQPILSGSKAERTVGNDERPKHRSRHALDGCCPSNGQVKPAHTAPKSPIGTPIAILARGIRLQI